MLIIYKSDYDGKNVKIFTDGQIKPMFFLGGDINLQYLNVKFIKYFMIKL